VAALAYFYLEPRKRFAGEVFLASCALYAAARFLIEYLRDDERGELLGLSTSQLIAAGIVAVVAVAWPRVRRAALRGRLESPGR
jgi:prolipoprotein diacylglyceryltransferase